jgi:hypothetical protein
VRHPICSRRAGGNLPNILFVIWQAGNLLTSLAAMDGSPSLFSVKGWALTQLRLPLETCRT